MIGEEEKESEMRKLILLRHGESVWNKENLFTGWTDVDLSRKGQAEAKAAGSLLRQNGFTFDIAYTSLLKRAVRTLWIVLEDMDLMWIPVQKSWRLNERHYGALQGQNKTSAAEKYGEEQVHIWRRSYDVRPPALTLDDKRYPGLDPRYRGLLPGQIPLTECLGDTVMRLLPYWLETIKPALQDGRDVLVVAHGNSLRALVKYLDHISDEDIVYLEIPTGSPLVYLLDDDLHPMKSYYLNGESEIAAPVSGIGCRGS